MVASMKQNTAIEVPSGPDETPIVVAAFYKFVALPDFQLVQPKLQAMCRKAGILGTILLAKEGINGTVCGSHRAVQALMDYFAN